MIDHEWITSMGIEISELNEDSKPVKPVMKQEVVSPNNKAMEEWMKREQERNSWLHALYVSFAMVFIGILLVCIMVTTADAGATFMAMTVVEVTEEKITVEEQYGASFIFYMDEDTAGAEVGDGATVVTDMIYRKQGVWVWNPDRTKIIKIIKRAKEVADE